MLFNSGNPSLLGLTRDLAGDPAGAPTTLWADQKIKDAINVKYSEIRNKVRALDVGYTKKVGYETSVTDQKNYSLPTDFIARLQVEISTTGKNLSTTAPSSADSIYLEAKPTELGLEIYNTNSLSGRRLVVIVGTEYWILGPPSSSEAGTNAIRLTYESESTALTNDTDEPVLPIPLHALIAYEAAIFLRVGFDLPVNDLEALTRPLRDQIDLTLVDSLRMTSHQIPVAGLNRPRVGRCTRMGQIRKS